MTTATEPITPSTADEVAALLHEAATSGRAVRPRGGGTKLAWGNAVAEPAIELSTAGLDAIAEHNEGDLTAILGAGTPLRRAQEAFAAAGQRLSLDPPLGPGDAATVGGILATADSGPLRHRFGAPRDLVLGVQVALPDGTVARAGGKVIKNVAGYDLAKLMAGAYGSLGVVCELSLRLHPIPSGTATAILEHADPDALAGAAAALSHAPLEHVSLDAAWSGSSGAVLARFAGATAADQARAATEAIGGEVREDDDWIWDAQRAAQRSPDGIVVRVSTTQRRLADLLVAARDLGARAVARAGLVCGWVTLPASAGAEGVEQLRKRMSGSPCVVLDAPAGVRSALDPWGPVDPGTLGLMRRVKERFDPQHVLNPGLPVGGL